jgi:hypothetical protein
MRTQEQQAILKELGIKTQSQLNLLIKKKGKAWVRELLGIGFSDKAPEKKQSQSAGKDEKRKATLNETHVYACFSFGLSFKVFEFSGLSNYESVSIARMCAKMGSLCAYIATEREIRGRGFELFLTDSEGIEIPSRDGLDVFFTFSDCCQKVSEKKTAMILRSWEKNFKPREIETRKVEPSVVPFPVRSWPAKKLELAELSCSNSLPIEHRFNQHTGEDTPVYANKTLNRIPQHISNGHDGHGDGPLLDTPSYIKHLRRHLESGEELLSEEIEEGIKVTVKTFKKERTRFWGGQAYHRTDELAQIRKPNLKSKWGDKLYRVVWVESRSS